MNEADYGQTDLAMNRGMNAGDEQLLVKFYPWSAKNHQKSEEQGRPVFETVNYISIRVAGNRDSQIERPMREKDKQRFPVHYERYMARENQEIVEGTPLTEWAGISQAQIEELKYMNVMTVEQLVSMSDTNAQKMRNIYATKDKAKRYLESAKEGLASEALAEQKAINADLLERLSALESNEPAKRGRPKKITEE